VIARDGVVLLYHRVCELSADPWGLAVTPAHFAEQMAVLRERAAAVPLGPLLAGEAHGVAVTFDDGYEDNAGVAADILADHGVPATFFITAGRLAAPEEFWWDRLERMLLSGQPAAPAVQVLVRQSPLWADVRSTAARQRAHEALYWRLRPQPPSLIDVVLDDVEKQLGAAGGNRRSHRMMSPAQLRTLAERPGIDIGAHTLSHPQLATQLVDVQRHEIAGSREHLQALLDREVSLFAYPYGDAQAFDATTKELVDEAGFDAACAVRAGPVEAATDPFDVPRHVVGDWDGVTFHERLDRWWAATG